MAKKPTNNDADSQAIRDMLAQAEAEQAPKNPKTGKPKKSADEIVRSAKNKGLARSRSKGVVTAATTSAAQIPDEEAGTKIGVVHVGADGLPIAEIRDLPTAINKTLGSQKIKIRVPKTVTRQVENATPEGMAFSGVKEYPESGNADPLQSMQNLSVELAGHIAKHRATAPVNYRGHFAALDRLVADADSDLSSATGAHNQGIISGNGNFRENRPFRASGYTNAIATLEPNHPAANMEPSNAVGYLTRAAHIHKYAAKRLKALTTELGTYGRSLATPFNGKLMGMPADKAADNIVRNYTTGQGMADAPYRNSAGYSAEDIGRKLSTGRGAPKVIPVEHYISRDENGNIEKRVRRAKNTGGEALDLLPGLDMDKVMGGRYVESGQQHSYNSTNPIKNNEELDTPREDDYDRAMKAARDSGNAKFTNDPGIANYKTSKEEFKAKVAARKAQDEAFATYEPNFVVSYKADHPEEIAQINTARRAWRKRQSARLTNQRVTAHNAEVPDISDEAKTKFIAGQIAKGHLPEHAEANWNKVVGYTKTRLQDFAYKSYAPNINATKAREEQEAKENPAATTPSLEDAVRSARFSIRQSAAAERQQASRPSAEATFGKIESLISSVHSRATRQNPNGSFINPQAAKSANLAMDALAKHKAGMWTSADGPGLHAHMAKAISHIYNSATSLAGRGDQHPDTLSVANSGSLQGLHKDYIADWSNGRNPMILGGSNVKYDSVKADTITKGKR